MQQPNKSDETEMEMLLNEIPHVTSPQYHHRHHHQGTDHVALPSSHDLLHANPHLHNGMTMDGDADVDILFDRFQSLYLNKEPIDPFALHRSPGVVTPRIPISPCSVLPLTGLCSENPNVGFDPYWDSNALNLGILRSPTRSLSPEGLKKNVEGVNSYLRTRNGGLYGSVYTLAKDQHGCRFLQGKFDEGRSQVDLIFDGVIGHVGELMMDPFGNYVVQKLFDVCSEEQRTTILLVLTEDPAAIFRISLDGRGTRSVQKLIETLKIHHQIALVMAALKPWLLDLMKDINGNHVIQHCITCFRADDAKFIFEAATRHCLEIATHRHGCCVLQRCIGCSVGEHRANLIAKVTSNGLQLAQDAFGNYVVQYIISLKVANANLAAQFEGNYVQLSMQKFSSNVVEKCFKEFTEDLKATIVFELLSASQFEELLQHPFANYVIRSALSNTKGSPHTALVDAIRPHAGLLRTSPYCKRIFSLLSKKSTAF